MIKFAFEKAGFHKVESFRRAANEASGKVMQKAGMKEASSVARIDIEGYSKPNIICYAIDNT